MQAPVHEGFCRLKPIMTLLHLTIIQLLAKQFNCMPQHAPSWLCISSSYFYQAAHEHWSKLVHHQK